MIISVTMGYSVQHHNLALYVSSPNLKAAVKRVERFFCQQTLTAKMYAKALVDLLGFKGNFKLRLGRTNWKFGKKDINYLVLSWQVSKTISFPLLFTELDKAGNSNAQERIDLIQMFIDLFGVERIEELVADREFIGEEWITYLFKKGIATYIRVRSNTLVPWGAGKRHVSDFLIHWDEDKPRKFEKTMYSTTVYFIGKKIEGDLLIIMTNKDIPVNQALNIYKQRWSIESLFKNLKTAGFNWERTHMKHSERLIKLLIIMSLATLFIYLVGCQQKIPFRKTVNCPLYSCFTAGLKKLRRLIVYSVKDLIQCLRQGFLSISLYFEKSGG